MEVQRSTVTVNLRHDLKIHPINSNLVRAQKQGETATGQIGQKNDVSPRQIRPVHVSHVLTLPVLTYIPPS